MARTVLINFTLSSHIIKVRIDGLTCNLVGTTRCSWSISKIVAVRVGRALEQAAVGDVDLQGDGR